MTPRRLVSTGEAAAAIGVHRRTLQRWIADGAATPAGRTRGGHARWDVEDLRRQFEKSG